ncbi:UNVERIFIED_CONTAM: Oleuropein beta-glucosidase [Sesamum radiatum]|uniref:Oleuropein beta-glucosidase n=1 Tax=Sesamum radiatum TaxID=300843 RepID=A0AAW2PMT7_SESRA
MESGKLCDEVPIVPYPPGVLPADNDNTKISRYDFHDDFLFGTATSAYQVEGAAAIGGKSISVWDDLTLRDPGGIDDQSNGNVSADMYHRFKEDIKMMKQMGFNSYRFSISWSRVLPGGRWSAGVNREGIDFYNDVIDTILKYEMTPHVTLFHFDLPHCLEKEYEGFLNRNIVDDFLEYVELCFWEFGDRVKIWTTINEPRSYAFNGYVIGFFPPNKVSCTFEEALRSMPTYKCSIDSMKTRKALEKAITVAHRGKICSPKYPYIVGKNLLLAHAEAVESYKTKFKESQGGTVGIALNSVWYVPYDRNSEEDIKAVRRGVDFMLGCYPKNMEDAIPPEAQLKHHEIEKIKGSIDFLGFNYYTTLVAKHDPNPKGEGYLADRKMEKDLYKTKEGLLIGEKSGAEWLHVVPWGLHVHLKFLKETYGDDLPPIHITENGFADKNTKEHTAYIASQDQLRIKYYQDHLAHLLHAMKKERVIVKGFFAWSWCDNFEWKEGYKVRFGIIYVDFNNNQTRYPKLSAMWFAKFLKAEKKLRAVEV